MFNYTAVADDYILIDTPEKLISTIRTKNVSKIIISNICGIEQYYILRLKSNKLANNRRLEVYRISKTNIVIRPHISVMMYDKNTYFIAEDVYILHELLFPKLRNPPQQ